METEKQITGFFECAPNEKSMARLLSFITSISGVIIFAAVMIISLVSGRAIDTAITNGCLYLIGIGVAGKTLSGAAESLANIPEGTKQ